MNRELEALLEVWDQFIQTPTGSEADRIYGLYQAQLDEVAGRSNVSKEALHRSVKRCHPRWVRANLPPGFPKNLGLQ
jgi:predicted DNA-binding protein YlxM (UPF0122 family)